MNRWWKNLPLLAAALAPAILLAEIALRIYDYGEPPAQELQAKEGLLSWRAVSRRATDPLHNMKYTFNRYGFRGEEWTMPKPAGLFRVAVLGDSFTFGAGVPDDQTLPAQLRALLEESHGPSIEVVNLGLSGSNTQQQAIVARMILPLLDPDAVVLVIVLNDAEVLGWNPDPVATGCVQLSPGEALDWWLLEHWYFYRPFHAWQAADRCQGPRRCLTSQFSGVSILARCFRTSLKGLAAEAGKKGRPFLAAYYPTPNPAYLDGSLPNEDRPAAEIRDITLAEGIKFVDLSPVFRGQDVLKLKVAEDVHPNGFAHGLAAAALAQELSAMLQETKDRLP